MKKIGVILVALLLVAQQIMQSVDHNLAWHDMMIAHIFNITTHTVLQRCLESTINTHFVGFSKVLFVDPSSQVKKPKKSLLLM